MKSGTFSKKPFTLVEILIVVVILGILAAIVLPQFTNFTTDAGKNTFITQMRTFVSAAELYHVKTGGYLENSNSGVCPAGFADYIQENKWTCGTPIGGVWDAEYNSFGIISALGVHFNGTGTTRNEAYMREIDSLLDNGDLTSGCFREIDSGRYYFVLAD